MESGWRSGPRHRPPPNPDPDHYNPAKGGCMCCGDREGVLEFALLRNGKPAGRWRLCGPCWEWGNPRNPQEADPLTA